MPHGHIHSPAKFDRFEVDLRTGELRKGGRRIRLQGQPFQVLSLLLSRPGELVSREDLHQELWPADTFVDFDHGLNSAIARLREALGDSADKPRYIETVAKRGYRFVAPLSNHAAAPSQSPEPANTASEVQPSGERRPSSRKFAVAIAAVCLGLLCAVGAWTAHRINSGSLLSRIEVVPVGAMRGFQATPAFSPDGGLLAFRESDGASNMGIYVAVIGGDKSLQLTRDRGDCCPTWSPDGSQIAFLRYSEKSFSIYIVPALGGTEHRVYEGPAGAAERLTWSGDARLVVFSECSAANPTRVRISALSLPDSSIRALTDPPPGYLDRNPTYSHDGSHIAFIRSTVAGVTNDIFVMPASGGEPKRVTFDNRPVMGPPAWTPDDREIVFSSDRGAATALWRISANGGTPSPVAGPVGAATWPSIPAKKGLLVYEQSLSNANIWRLDLKDHTHLDKPPFAIISEKGSKARPDLSPGGKKIAFESDRLGFWDIWTCNSDGTDCVRATSLRGTAGRARWSPDGHTLAFEFHPNERGEIYLVELPGGTPRLIPTVPGADNLSPSSSNDGKWLYFASKRGNEPFQAWKIPAAGGTPIQLTKSGGISPIESPDGRFLYYSKYEQGGLWRRPLDGGEETEVVREVTGYQWPDWVVTRDGIYFLRFDQTSHGGVEFLEFATGKTAEVWNSDRDMGWGLAGSQDGRSLMYIQDEFSESDIMLIKNFR